MQRQRAIHGGVLAQGVGAMTYGSLCSGIGDTGALIRMPTGIYVQGNAGAIRGLPQAEVAASMAAASLGRLGGTTSTPRKAEAARKNGQKGGRPRKKHGV